MKPFALLTLTSALIFTSISVAEERPDHFKGKAAPTLEAALANLAESNAKLEALIEKKALEATDLHQVHLLSYTLENALEKLAKEQARLAKLMEEVHLASERGDAKKVKSSGAAYLKGAAPLAR